MRITISGPPGSGKSTVSKDLADRFNLKLISSGEVFRQLAHERRVSLAEFGELAEKDPSIDRLIDDRQIQIAREQDNLVIESRLSGWLIEEADLRVWLGGSLEERAHRVAPRDGTSIEQAIKDTIEREESEAKRYKQYYDIDIHDMSPYHLVIDTARWDQEGVTNIISAAIRELR